jgi:hypothetical protein
MEHATQMIATARNTKAYKILCVDDDLERLHVLTDQTEGWLNRH